MKVRGDVKPREQTLRDKRTVPATATIRTFHRMRIPFEWAPDGSRTSPTPQRSRQCSWLNVATHDQQEVFQSAHVPRKAYAKHLRANLGSRQIWALLVNLLGGHFTFLLSRSPPHRHQLQLLVRVDYPRHASFFNMIVSLEQPMPQESDTLINGTLCPLLAVKFVGGILVWHVIPSLRLLRRDLIDVHRLSSDPRYRCAKDLIPTLFVSLRIWSRLELLTDLLIVRTDDNILLHWQREHSSDNSSLRRQICKCLE